MVLVASALFLLFAGTALAESETVTAEGMAALQGDQAQARDAAIRDALRKGIEQTVGLLLASDTLVENSELVRDSIYSKTQGYVKRYKIKKEGPAQNVYAVTVEAEVELGAVKTDLAALGLLQARMGKPRTLFMTVEQKIGRETPVYWWSAGGQPADDTAVSESTLKEEFIAKEFNVLDTAAVVSRLEGVPGRSGEPSDALLREIGRRAGAEIVIKSRARTMEGARNAGSSVGSYMAEITATAVRVDTGQVLATARGKGVSRHVAQNMGEQAALEQAAREAAGKLVEQIAAKWSAEADGAQPVTVTLRGLRSVKDLAEVREILTRRVFGVSGLIQRSYHDGVAVMDLNAKVGAQQLAERLGGEKFPGVGFEVTRATANTIELKAVFGE